MIVTAILIEGELHQYLDLPAFMIVFGGTVAATFITFQMKDVISAFKAAIFVFSERGEDPNDMVATMIELCTLSRRQGIVSLSKLEIESAFLKKACNLIADGSKEEVIRDSLQIEIDAMKQRHFIVQDIFRKMALFSPSFGMIGTLIGLIQMLSRLSTPETVGPSMSVAMVATFYGATFAYLFFLPIAGKLRAKTLVEVMNLQIIFEGAISILDNNNPLLVYEKLSSYIPVKLRRPMQNQMLKR